jgi:hypothetical protein
LTTHNPQKQHHPQQNREQEKPSTREEVSPSSEQESPFIRELEVKIGRTIIMEDFTKYLIGICLNLEAIIRNNASIMGGWKSQKNKE